ncbi:MAG TPA: nitroreductase family deazaflavin-dependent oxidoreductase [Anaerolineaceae bacterium]|nr:nitroreductase family deazaflavin-dependent oxidoreductase [Anaerolineaceae bacterium]
MNVDFLRSAFRILNVYMVFMWKLGLGKLLNCWPKGFGQFIIITHYGRISGNKYLTPVNYAEIEDKIYCTSGFGIQSDWYRNLLHNPSIEIWMSTGWWQAKAEDISNHPDRIKIMREVLIGSGFAASLFGIHHTKMDDEELDQVTKDYRLLKIERVSERTGVDGPNEFAWIWPVISFLLLLILRFRKRKK